MTEPVERESPRWEPDISNAEAGRITVPSTTLSGQSTGKLTGGGYTATGFALVETHLGGPSSLSTSICERKHSQRCKFHFVGLWWTLPIMQFRQLPGSCQIA